MFDSHARNCFGMPDPNGTAVVMKYADINNYWNCIYFCTNCKIIYTNTLELRKYNASGAVLERLRLSSTPLHNATASSIQHNPAYGVEINSKFWDIAKPRNIIISINHLPFFNIKNLLTESEVCTGKYLTEVLAVRTEPQTRSVQYRNILDR